MPTLNLTVIKKTTNNNWKGLGSLIPEALELADWIIPRWRRRTEYTPRIPDDESSTQNIPLQLFFKPQPEPLHVTGI